MKFRLVTADSQFVALVDVLPFQSLPGVAIWGERVFVLRPEASWSEPGLPEYGEAFAYWIPPAAPDRATTLVPLC